MSKKISARKFVVALLALACAFALASCGGPKVFNYGKGEPNITVDEA